MAKLPKRAVSALAFSYAGFATAIAKLVGSFPSEKEHLVDGDSAWNGGSYD